MNRLKKIIMMVLIAAIVTLGSTGCKRKGEHPQSEQPDQNAPAGEHPKN